jgi:hypothetical protein
LPPKSSPLDPLPPLPPLPPNPPHLPSRCHRQFGQARPAVVAEQQVRPALGRTGQKALGPIGVVVVVVVGVAVVEEEGPSRMGWEGPLLEAAVHQPGPARENRWRRRN